MRSPKTAAPYTVLSIGPTCNSGFVGNGGTPCVMRLYEGFQPTTPHGAAGMRTEPPASLPSVDATRNAAAAAAERSEERRVGKEGGARRARAQRKKRAARGGGRA